MASAQRTRKTRAFYVVLAVLLAGIAMIVGAAFQLASGPPTNPGYLIALVMGSIAVTAVLLPYVTRSVPIEVPKMYLRAEARNLTEKLEKCIQKVAELDQSGHWARPAFFAFLDTLIQRTLEMTNHLSQLSTQVHDEEPPEIPLVWPLPDAVADVLLARMMRGLQKDDTYDAVSNAQIWTGLGDFLREQKAAVVENNVTIRRVFVVDHESDEDLPVGEISDIIMFHDRFTRAWKSNAPGGGYQIRGVMRERYKLVAPHLSAMLHFGVFHPAKAPKRPTIAFRVVNKDLSEMSVSTAAKTGPFVAEFKVLWNESKPFSEPEVRYAFRKHLLQRMNPGGRYLAVSRLKEWMDHDRQKFLDDCIEIAKLRQLRLERMFAWVKDDLSEEELRAVLQCEKQRQDACEGKFYRWKIHTSYTPPPREDWSIIAYDDPHAASTGSRAAAFTEFLDLHGANEQPTTMTVGAFDRLWANTDKEKELAKLFSDSGRQFL